MKLLSRQKIQFVKDVQAVRFITIRIGAKKRVGFTTWDASKAPSARANSHWSKHKFARYFIDFMLGRLLIGCQLTNNNLSTLLGR